jgi:hypothetical protein
MKKIAVISREEAREQAIDFMNLQATENMSYEEILEWQNYFYHIAKKYDLEDEFTENGVI